MTSTLDTVIKHLHNQLHVGTKYSVSAPLSKFVVNVDQMPQEVLEYFIEHEFCNKSQFSRIENGVAYDVIIHFNSTEFTTLEMGVI